MNSIIYPGTFDPITLGHVDLVERSAKLFDKVVLAIAYSEKKLPLFSLEERIELCEQSLSHLKNIEVCGFNTLVVDFAKSKDCKTALRGVRTVADFEYERQLANMNRSMHPDFETIFMTPADRLSYISSSLLREIAGLGGDVSAYVPAAVNTALQSRFA